jgi:hypothetical protein
MPGGRLLFAERRNKGVSVIATETYSDCGKIAEVDSRLRCYRECYRKSATKLLQNTPYSLCHVAEIPNEK